MNKRTSVEKDIARKRINRLFSSAEKAFHENSEHSDRYVAIARKISQKYKVKIPIPLKRRFCRHCNTFLVPSKNCRIRLHKERVIYYCLKCRKFTRMPYKPHKTS